MSCCRRGRAAAAALLVAFSASRGGAARPAGSPGQPPAAQALPSPWYWDGERARPFVAGRVGIGASAYAELDAGYGKPYWLWAGFQGWGLSTSEAVMASAGFKIGLPIFELSGGYRLVHSFARAPLPEQTSYDSSDLEAHDAAHGYAALDLDALGFVPLPHFVAVPQLGLHYVKDEPGALYEEEQRVIMVGSWLFYTKLALLFTWGPGRRYALGPRLERFWNGRSRGVTRLGPSFALRFTPHLDLVLLATLPVAGPDELSFYDGLGGSLSVRYRWASQERAPAFP